MATKSVPLLESEEAGWFFGEPGTVRSAAAALAGRIGLDAQRAGEVSVAITEAATNLGKHAVHGAVVLRVVRAGPHTGLEFLTMDSGPGIQDLDAALRDGTSSTGTLGIGLGAVARLADAFAVHSLPGRGTVLAARFWPHEKGGASRVAPGEPVAAGLTRTSSGEQVCGDAWSARGDDESVTVLMCDGLGLGPPARAAARAAILAFHASDSSAPEAMMREIHAALLGTRGAAVAIARIEPWARRLEYCGVGSIEGSLVGPDTRADLTSHPGIVGHQMLMLRTAEHPLSPGSALVMHSDGLAGRWSAQTLPGVFAHPPIVLATELMREAVDRRDDAVVVVAKGLW